MFGSAVYVQKKKVATPCGPLHKLRNVSHRRVRAKKKSCHPLPPSRTPHTLRDVWCRRARPKKKSCNHCRSTHAKKCLVPQCACRKKRVAASCPTLHTLRNVWYRRVSAKKKRLRTPAIPVQNTEMFGAALNMQKKRGCYPLPAFPHTLRNVW